MSEFLEAVTSDDRRVLEADLGDEEPAELGPGSVDVDSWGDHPTVIAAYEELGFAVVERVGGWQRRLD